MFDDLLVSIARISKKLPKLVIDLVMRWRKSQSEGIDPVSVQRAMCVQCRRASKLLELITCDRATAPNPVTARNVADSLNERKSVCSYLMS